MITSALRKNTDLFKTWCFQDPNFTLMTLKMVSDLL